MIQRSLALLLLAATCAFAQETRVIDLSPIARWLERQSKIRTIEADMTQSRALKTLRSPAKADGRFWFEAPDRFRWQIGDPPRTIAIGDGETITVIDGRRRTATRTRVADLKNDASLRGMAEFPFAPDFATFRERFEVRDLRIDGTVCRVEMLPRDPAARKMLTRIILTFDTESGHLLSFEAVTKDGSSLRNEFSNVKLDRKLDPSIFAPDLSGYDVQDSR